MSMSLQPPFSNRLIHEKSPYLLQHAHDPVDWYPWGKEAFELAKEQNKPIFLSIGYATCHWCHVMARESFHNKEIARLMNDAFVNIKVDREELPAIDSIYMEFAQALMSSSGGWPLNVLLTPELKPFFAITYLPPDGRRGLVGMPQFIQQIHQLWQSDEREHLIAQAEQLTEVFERSAQLSGDAIPSQTQILDSVEVLFELIDPVYGGLKGEPKFPLGYQASFLLGYGSAHQDSRALFCVELTLDHMLQGGIYDQLGGGFSRYAVDERWMIPHFEKMLYDNAILVSTYLHAWKVSKKNDYARIVKETLDYLLRDMAHVDGGFYSAEDADSDGHEGLYYTWTPKEISEVLSHDEAELFCKNYGVTSEGNFEGRSVLHLQVRDDAEVNLDHVKLELFKKRCTRPRPFRDDKIICSWNGLMIDALTLAADALNQPHYRKAALKTAAFLHANLYRDGHLFRRYREGEARFSGGLDDYAFYIKGLLTLFEDGNGSHFLSQALQLEEILYREFKADDGAYFYAKDASHLLIRKCEYYDGAEPSGNAVHCENLLRLYQLTQENNYLKRAEDVLKAAKHYIDHYPPGACYHLIALQRYYDTQARTIVIALDEKQSLAQEIRSFLATSFSLHRCVIWKRHDDYRLVELIPSLVDKNPLDGQTAVYICYQDRCEAPLLELKEILKAL